MNSVNIKTICLVIIGQTLICHMTHGQTKTTCEIFNTNEEVAKSISQTMFDAFPTSFQEYNALWGENGCISDRALVVLFLCGNPYVNQRDFAKKLVRLTAGAKWQVDGVNFLQEVIHQMLISKNIDSYILNEMTENTMFWQFVFSGIYPENYKHLKDEAEINLPQNRYKYYYLITEMYGYCLEHPIR